MKRRRAAVNFDRVVESGSGIMVLALEDWGLRRWVRGLLLAP